MTTVTYTVTETAATGVARQLKIGVRAKSGSSIPSPVTDWPGDAYPVMTFNLAVGATSASDTLTTKGNTAIDGNREFEFYEISRSPPGGTLSMSPSFAVITDDDQTAPVVISNWTYSDDLEDAAKDSDILLRPNWATANAGANTWQVGSYAYGKSVHSYALYRASGEILFGPDLNTDGSDFGFEVEFDECRAGNVGEQNGNAYTVANQSFALFYRDKDNWLKLSNQSDGISPRVEQAISGGTATNVFNTFQHRLQTPPASAPAGTVSNKFVLQYHKGRLRYRFAAGEWALGNNNSAWPRDSITMTNLPGLTTVATRIGKVGMQAATYIYPILNGMRIRALRMVITEHARYCSRTTASSGVGRIWIKGDYRGTPKRWAYRVIAKPGSTVVQDWRDISDVTLDSSAGTFSATAIIPQGGPYEIELAMTDGDGVTSNTWTKRVACGEFYITNGQSNSVNRSGPISTGLTTFAANVPSQKYLGTNTDNVPAYELTGMGTTEYPFARNVEMSRIIASKTGVPCLVLSTGVSGSAITGVSDDANFAATFVKTRQTIDGVVDGILWDQGEGDRDGTYDPTQYYTNLKAIYLKMVNATGNPNLPMWISPIGRYASTSPANGSTTWARMDAYARTVKLGYEALIAEYPTLVRYSDTKLGTLHGTDAGQADAYHYQASAYEEMSRRAGRTVLKDRGFDVPGGRGPVPTGLTRSGATLTLAINLNGAGALTDLVTKSTDPDNVRGTPALSGALYGYEVSSDGFATLLAISSIVRSGSSLVITLAADPGKAVQIRSYHGASYDDRQMFWGTGYSGGYEDVPVFPITNYLSSN